jgi:ABC-type multidrug transport system ATPase subunit
MLMSDTVLEIKGLTKRYGRFTAVDNLSLSVKRGEVFGLLGPNGSGKTTTLGILLGALNATNGSFSWFGNGEKDENRTRIGSLLETPNFYPYLDAVDNLQVVAKIKGVINATERIETVLKRVNLWERKKFKFRQYSLGMKQRLAIASALLSDPEVLVLDEPTNGLDPQGIAEMRRLITAIAAEGKTIIIASHILDEVEKICTHVAILRKGKLLRQETMSDILQQEQQYLVSAENMEELRQSLTAIADVEIRHTEPGVLTIASRTKQPQQINRELAEKGVYLSSLTEHKKSLEKIFLEIVEE